ncbi:MAG: hypothetical protein AB7F86_04435 [Bdellovibrionales bacterium]
MKYLILLFFVPFAHAGIYQNTFKDPESGFAIEKPADWKFVEAPKAHGLKLKNDKQMKAVNKTIVTFTKPMGKDFGGVRPTVGVEKLTLPKNSTPVKWLAQELKRQEKHDKYFVPASQALETTIDQVDHAARAAYVNSTVIQGVEVKVYHVLYVVPSGGKTFLINMNCNESLAQEYVGKFGEIAETISARKGGAQDSE